MHIPKADTYRPLLGDGVNRALFQLVEKKNRDALIPLSVNEWLRKMIAHWWSGEFPDREFPVELKRYYEDMDL